MNRPPMRNLGPNAEPWGRWVDERLDALDASDQVANSMSDNNGRMTSSSIQSIGSQVNELYARQTLYASGHDMATAFFTTGVSATVSQTIQLPRPTDAHRSGWLSVQSILDLDGPSDAWSSGFLSYYLDDNLIGAFTYGLPFVGAGIEWFKQGASVSYSSLIASPDFGATLRIDLSGSGAGSASSKRVILSGIQATIQYGQRVG